jgi:hypothetical protein
MVNAVGIEPTTSRVKGRSRIGVAGSAALESNIWSRAYCRGTTTWRCTGPQKGSHPCSLLGQPIRSCTFSQSWSSRHPRAACRPYRPLSRRTSRPAPSPSRPPRSKLARWLISHASWNALPLKSLATKAYDDVAKATRGREANTGNATDASSGT